MGENTNGLQSLSTNPGCPILVARRGPREKGGVAQSCPALSTGEQPMGENTNGPQPLSTNPGSPILVARRGPREKGGVAQTSPALSTSEQPMCENTNGPQPLSTNPGSPILVARRDPREKGGVAQTSPALSTGEQPMGESTDPCSFAPRRPLFCSPLFCRPLPRRIAQPYKCHHPAHGESQVHPTARSKLLRHRIVKGFAPSLDTQVPSPNAAAHFKNSDSPHPLRRLRLLPPVPCSIGIDQSSNPALLKLPQLLPPAISNLLRILPRRNCLERSAIHEQRAHLL